MASGTTGLRCRLFPESQDERTQRSTQSLGYSAMESTEGVRQFHQQSGGRFAAHFQAVAHRASEDLKPQVRWETARHWAGASPDGNLQRLDKEAIIILEQELANLLHAIHLAHSLRQWTLVCQLADGLAVFFNRRSHWSDWVQVAELAVADAESVSNLRLKAEALNNLGLVYRHVERLSEAADCCKRSIDLCRQLDERYCEGRALGNLGGVYFAENDSRTALECYETGLHIFENLHDQYGQAQSLMGMGICLARQGKLAEATSRLESCLSMQRGIGDRFGEAQTLNNLGIVQREQGNISEAVISFQASLRIKRELRDQHGTALALSNLAVAYQQSGDIDQEIAAREEACSLLNSLHSPAVDRMARRLAHARVRRQRQQEDGTGIA